MKHMKTKDLVLCAMFVALIAVGAFIKIPVPVVPFTLQFLFTMLAGLLLAARSDYIEVNGRRYPRTPVALSEQPVSDGGGYHALWGAAEERGRGHEAVDVAEAAVAQSAKAG